MTELYLPKRVRAQRARREREREIYTQLRISSPALAQCARAERKKIQKIEHQASGQGISNTAEREEKNDKREAVNNVVTSEPAVHPVSREKVPTCTPCYETPRVHFFTTNPRPWLRQPQYSVSAQSSITSITLGRNPPPVTRIDTSSLMNHINIHCSLKNIYRVVEASKDKDIVIKQNQDEIRKTVPAQSPHGSNIGLRNEIVNGLSPKKMNIKQSVPESKAKSLPPCNKSKREVTEGSLSLTTHPKREGPIRFMAKPRTSFDLDMPTTKGEAAAHIEKHDKTQSWIDMLSSTSAGSNDFPTPSSAQEKISSVSECSSVTLHSREGEQCASSESQVQTSQKDLVRSSSIILKSQELKLQNEGEGKQTTKDTDTEDQSEGMVSEVSVEEGSPDNRVTSQLNVAVTSREASMHGHEVPKSLCLAKCPLNLEGHTDTGNQCYKAIEDVEKETVPQAFLVDHRSDEVTFENGSLPFTKSYPLWGNVESMEVFRLMPQHPHFHPLQQVNELLREGQALGYMLTFANVIDKVNKAQLDEPYSTFENELETLIELEANGFNVHPVRARIKKLLRIKDTRARLHEEFEQVKGQIGKEEKEESIISVVDEIDEKFRELQESIAEIMKQQQMVVMENKTT
ncbi:hypothetical protein IFM89_012640 [Coptis chinensis]|uniref:Uncharacterized protein n=1 Tax=Coptis chinensis TaxID=261450 RepID=A0A835IPI9_9MAGN|nr:hypothetical protein IFM89_012640 [Coptis chinensis]